MALSEREKAEVYKTYCKKTPKDSSGSYIALLLFFFIMMTYMYGIGPVSNFVVEKGLSTDPTYITLFSYLGVLIISAPMIILAFVAKKVAEKRYKQRCADIKEANSALWEALHGQDKYADWKAVVEKYKNVK